MISIPRKRKRSARTRRLRMVETLEDRRLLACTVNEVFDMTSGSMNPHGGGEIELSLTIDEAVPNGSGRCLINVTSAGMATEYNVDGTLTGAIPQLPNRQHTLALNLFAGADLVGSDNQLDQVSTTAFDIDFAIPSVELPDGMYSMSATLIRNNDGFEATVPLGALFQLQVDRTAPGVPETPVLQAASDSGVSDSDRITNAAMLTFDLGLDPETVATASELELLRDDDDDDDPTDDVVVDATETPLVSNALTDDSPPEGDFFYRARVRDAGGNESVSPAIRVTVDRTAPPALQDFGLAVSSDVLQPGVGFDADAIDGITFDTTPSFSFAEVADFGTDVVRILDGAAEVKSSVGGSNDVVTVTETLNAGSRTINALRVDLAGNESGVVSDSITIDTAIGADTISSPGTPVHTTVFDLGDAFGDNTQPWQMTFDRVTQTIWVSAENGLLNGDPSVSQFDPATGRLTRFDLSGLGDRGENSHGTFFDFNSHLTPRIWVAHRARQSESTRLSFLDVDFNERDVRDSQVVSYDFAGLDVPTDGDSDNAAEPVRDLHAVFVDRRGTVWATSLLGDRILEVRAGMPPDGGNIDRASLDATVIVHNVPPELVEGIPPNDSDAVPESFNAHALEVAVDDNTGETYVWLVAGEGGGRTALLRPTKTTLLGNANAGSDVIRVFNQIEPGTELRLNPGGNNEQLVVVSAVTEDRGAFLLTLDSPLVEAHFSGEEVRGPNRWNTWDVGDIDVSGTGIDLENVRGTFTKIDNNETAGDPTDDRIIISMPVGSAALQPTPTAGIVHVLNAGPTLNDENADATLHTYLIPRVEGAPATHQFAAPNQPFADRGGEAFFIDRIGGIGRFHPTEMTPAFSGTVSTISTVTDTSDLNDPLLLEPADVIPADGIIHETTLVPEIERGETVSDQSKVDGLDLYRLSGASGNQIPSRGAGPFRGFLNAENTLYGSLSQNDKLSVSVFAEATRRQMTAVSGPAPAEGALIQSRMAFQVLRNGSLILTGRGNGSIGDEQTNLLVGLQDQGRADFDQHAIVGDATAIRDSDGRVHVVGRSRTRGTVVQYTFTPPNPDVWNQSEIFDLTNWSVTDREIFDAILAEDVSPAGPLGFAVTTSEGRLLTFPVDGGGAVDLTSQSDDFELARVFSSVGFTRPTAANAPLFAYGTNQTGNLIEFRFDDFDASADPKTLQPTIREIQADGRDTHLLRSVRVMSDGDVRNVFGTDGVSRLVHYEITDGGAVQTNVTDQTADSPGSGMGPNFGYYPSQRSFAGRVYTYIEPLMESDGTLRVYGTNGANLIEFTRPPGETWRVANLTQNTNATFGDDVSSLRVPANAVFGGPAAYIDANGGRHILQINAEGEVIEYFTYGDGLFGTDPISADRINTQNVNFFSGRTMTSLVGDVPELEPPAAVALPAVVPAASQVASQAEAEDVNRDGIVTALDALLVINHLSTTDNAEGEGFDAAAPDDYDLDVNGDGLTTPLDALLVINYLMQDDVKSDAEAEASWLDLSDEDDEAEWGLRVDQVMDGVNGSGLW